MTDSRCEKNDAVAIGERRQWFGSCPLGMAVNGCGFNRSRRRRPFCRSNNKRHKLCKRRLLRIP